MIFSVSPPVQSTSPVHQSSPPVQSTSPVIVDGPEARQARLGTDHQRTRERRSAEQPEARQARLERLRERNREQRAAEQAEARQARLAQARPHNVLHFLVTTDHASLKEVTPACIKEHTKISCQRTTTKASDFFFFL